MAIAPTQRPEPGPARATRSAKIALFALSLALSAVLGARPARLSSESAVDLAEQGVHARLALDEAPGMATVPHRDRPRLRRPGLRFSFAVISDTHNEGTCDVEQGPKLAEAVRVVNGLEPEFVVGVGDLVAGGGDCLEWGRGYPDHDLEHQLAVLKRDLLDRLEAPFVPVSGNHELSTAGTRDSEYPRRTWVAFWKANQGHVLPEARPIVERRSHRFTYKGIGFTLLGFYGTMGLNPKELAFAAANVQTADLVFRHVNPYGISCGRQGYCGFAIRNHPTPRYEQLTDLLRARDVTALFAGHTHAFYDGRCDGLRFVNTGTLGDRSMEFVKGWDRSPFRERQAFVWVDVLTNASIRVTFFVWDPTHRTYLAFDNRYFPREVLAERKGHKAFSEGVPATCRSNRLPPDEHWGYLRRRAEAARLARLALEVGRTARAPAAHPGAAAPHGFARRSGPPEPGLPTRWLPAP